jgi:GNAT superfamily N-acetyltransferase
MFWTLYPINNIYKIILNREVFKALLFERESNITFTHKIINYNTVHNKEILTLIKHFIKTHFGSPPKTPILDIPELKLIGEKDHILYIEYNNNIVGCIRYHYLGEFITSNNEPIYCIDCFCIHPDWRKKGLGDYLLSSLHNYVNQNNIPYSIFLKEGKQLNIILRPYYSGIYTYRKINNSISPNVESLSIYQAYKLIDIYREFNKDLFIIYNKSNFNQFWKLYRKNGHYILACFQDTYQIFNENGKQKKIGWITAWIESPNMTHNYREEASKELSDSMYSSFDYIWANKEWTGNSNSWKDDGPFYWYLYQWTTSIHIGKSYCIMN